MSTCLIVLTNKRSPKAHGSSGGIPYTVTSSHSVVVCSVFFQTTQCDGVGGVSGCDVCCTTDSVALCKVSVSLLTIVENVVGLSSVCYTGDNDSDGGISGVDSMHSSSGSVGN